MLDGPKKRTGIVKFFKSLFIALFVCSLIFIFIYGNFLMVNRPRAKILSEGLIYPFFGKGGAIFISKLDYGLMVGSGVLLVVSMIAANWFASVENKK